MVQESVMIAVDNSEWMRNGDLTPTRMQCQQDAVNFVLHSKLRANPENGVGLLSMSPNVSVLSTITRDDRKLFMKLHGMNVEGQCHLFNAIKIAHLALRHRQNRNHKMRIIVFIGSPLEEINENEFIRLAKKLKKEKVNVDFVCFGEVSQNDKDEKLLHGFVETLNTKDTQNSHLLAVNAGVKLMDALVSSPICRGEDGAPLGGGMDFGNLEEDDPELALALRVSLEEQRQRQQREEGAAAPADAPMEVDASGQLQQPPPQQQQQLQQLEQQAEAAGASDPLMMSEDEQMAMAIRLSMMDAEGEAQAAEPEQPADRSMDLDHTQPDTTSASLGTLIDDPDLLARMVDQLPDAGKPADKPKPGAKPDDKPQ